MAFQPPSLIDPGVSSPTWNRLSACVESVVVDEGPVAVDAVSDCRQETANRKKTSRARFIVRGFYGLPVGGGQ